MFESIRKKIQSILKEEFDIQEIYPSTFSFQELGNIGSYAGKLKYAENHLQKLASGSARVVYKVDDNKVLKMAKNKKGLAQNSMEAEGYLQNYDVVAKVFETDEDDRWIEMEFAKKVKPTDFTKIVGIDFNSFKQYLTYRRFQERPSKYFKYSVPEEIKQKAENNEFVQEIIEFSLSNDMEMSDFERLSSYGKVIRDNKETIVLIDFGLSRGIYSDYYSVS